MAEGVRIRHTTLRGPAVVAIRDLSHRGQPGPRGEYPGCAACEIPPPGHEGWRTKHVRIDADGCAIVAVPYWQELQKFFDNGGFELLNPVPEPPRQQLLMTNGQGKLIVHHKMMQPILSKDLKKGKG